MIYIGDGRPDLAKGAAFRSGAGRPSTPQDGLLGGLISYAAGTGVFRHAQ